MQACDSGRERAVGEHEGGRPHEVTSYLPAGNLDDDGWIEEVLRPAEPRQRAERDQEGQGAGQSQPGLETGHGAGVRGPVLQIREGLVDEPRHQRPDPGAAGGVEEIDRRETQLGQLDPRQIAAADPEVPREVSEDVPSRALAASTICSSIAPPPTVPRRDPSGRTTILEPGFWGVEPADSITVATTKARPSAESWAICW